MPAAPIPKTPKQYLAALDEPRRSALTRLHEAIVKAAPSLEPHLLSGMLAYGNVHYKTASGREGEWAVVALASRKQYISLYLCIAENGEYLAEKNARRLGKVKVGRSCITFKQLEDLDLPVAMELVRRAETLRATPGSFTM